MSLKKLASFVIIATLASASAAQAAFTFDLASVVDGEFGEIQQNGTSGAFTGNVKGVLSSNLRIDFDYTLNDGTFANVINAAQYNFINGPHHYTGFSTSNAATSSTVSSDEIDSVNSPVQLLFTTANIDAPNHATSSIVNYSTGNSTFIESLIGVISALSNKNLTIRYAVSSVPLPAMAPLFGAALAGLGFAARRKAKASA